MSCPLTLRSTTPVDIRRWHERWRLIEGVRGNAAFDDGIEVGPYAWGERQIEFTECPGEQRPLLRSERAIRGRAVESRGKNRISDREVRKQPHVVKVATQRFAHRVCLP